MLTLILGNYNYSSWSLRAWLVAQASGLPFEVERYAMGSDAFQSAVYAANPAGLVPILKIEKAGSTHVINDSLAIAEFLAEQQATLWPSDAMTRAKARSMAAEMHSGFSALRSAMPMNLTGALRRVDVTPEVQADIDQVQALWTYHLKESGGPWLFGAWSIADAFYAPVAQRLKTYQVSLNDLSSRYIDTTIADPKMQTWQALANDEEERMERYDTIGLE